MGWDIKFCPNLFRLNLYPYADPYLNLFHEVRHQSLPRPPCFLGCLTFLLSEIVYPKLAHVMQMWGGGWGELIYIFIFLKKSPGLSAQDYEQSFLLVLILCPEWNVSTRVFNWWRFLFTSLPRDLLRSFLDSRFVYWPCDGGCCLHSPNDVRDDKVWCDCGVISLFN